MQNCRVFLIIRRNIGLLNKMRITKNQEGPTETKGRLRINKGEPIETEIKLTHQLLIYAEDLSLLRDNVHIMKRNMNFN
jgi:hypothetical protein